MQPPEPLRGHRPDLLILTLVVLLPAALAGQQPTPAAIPSLPAVEDDRQPARTAAVPGSDAHSAATPLAAPAPSVLDVALAWASAGPSSDAGLRRPTSPHREDLAAPPAPSTAEDADQSLGSLGDVLPRGLCRDLRELRARIQRYRTVLFGQRGILRWGELEGSEDQSRVRLNLQADPQPGVRVTLVTR